jgi:hypothetical protein
VHAFSQQDIRRFGEIGNEGDKDELPEAGLMVKFARDMADRLWKTNTNHKSTEWNINERDNVISS